MIVATVPKSRRGAARLRYPVLAVKNRGGHGILMRPGIITGISDRYPRTDIGPLLSGRATVRVPAFCLRCYERANIPGISDNDELYVPRNVANPGAPYSSPGSLLVNKLARDGFFVAARCAFI